MEKGEFLASMRENAISNLGEGEFNMPGDWKPEDIPNLGISLLDTDERKIPLAEPKGPSGSIGSGPEAQSFVRWKVISPREDLVAAIEQLESDIEAAENPEGEERKPTDLMMRTRISCLKATLVDGIRYDICGPDAMLRAIAEARKGMALVA